MEELEPQDSNPEDEWEVVKEEDIPLVQAASKNETEETKEDILNSLSGQNYKS